MELEQIFRRYFWVVHLAFLALAALLLARIVNLFVEAAVAPAPSTQPTRYCSTAAGM